MKVTLINQKQAQGLYQTWGEFARICYNSPKGTEESIGRSCHFLIATGLWQICNVT